MAGANPSFQRLHLIRTLFILKNGKVSRKRLTSELGLGEGSVRTLLNRLKKEGYLESDRQGHSLTGEGLKALLDLGFAAPQKVEIKGIEKLTGRNMQVSAVVVHEAAGDIGTGMEQRDRAYFAGASGAIVLVYDGGRLRFPTADVLVSDFPGLEKALMGQGLKEEDAVILAFSPKYPLAEDGAVGAALEIKKPGLL